MGLLEHRSWHFRENILAEVFPHTHIHNAKIPITISTSGTRLVFPYSSPCLTESTKRLVYVMVLHVESSSRYANTYNTAWLAGFPASQAVFSSPWKSEEVRCNGLLGFKLESIYQHS